MCEPCPTSCLDRVPDAFPTTWLPKDALTWLSAVDVSSPEERVLLYLVYGGRVLNLQGSLPDWWSNEQLLDDLRHVLSDQTSYLRVPVVCTAPKLLRRITCLCQRCRVSPRQFAESLPWSNLSHQERMLHQYRPGSQVNRTVSELKRKLFKAP